jgi:hypothetical protein
MSEMFTVKSMYLNPLNVQIYKQLKIKKNYVVPSPKIHFN